MENQNSTGNNSVNPISDASTKATPATTAAPASPTTPVTPSPSVTPAAAAQSPIPAAIPTPTIRTIVSNPQSKGPTPPVNNRKWAIIGAGGLLVIGLLSYFLSGSGLFKGQLTLNQSNTELGKLASHIKPLSVQVDPYAWPPKAGKETRLEVLDNAPSDAVFWSNKGAGTWKVIQADFTTSVAGNMMSLTNKSLAKNIDIKKMEIVIEDANGKVVSTDTFSGQTLANITGKTYSKTLNEAGTYNISLTVSDDKGHSDSKTSEFVTTEATLVPNVVFSLPNDQAIANITASNTAVSNVEMIKFQLADSIKVTDVSEIDLQLSTKDSTKISDIENLKLYVANKSVATSIGNNGLFILKPTNPLALTLDTPTTFTVKGNFNAVTAGVTYKVTVSDIKFTDSSTVYTVAAGTSPYAEKTVVSEGSETATVAAISCTNALATTDAAPYKYTFSSSATDTTGASVNLNSTDWTWEWDFNDGPHGTTPNTATHQYNQTAIAQTILPRLQITNKKDSKIVKQANCPNISIPAKTISTATIDSLICNDVLSSTLNTPLAYDFSSIAMVQVNGTELAPGTSDWTWSWNFGDNTPVNTTANTVTYTYSQTDTAQALAPTLTLTNKNTPSITQQVNCPSLNLPAKVVATPTLVADFTCEYVFQDATNYMIKFTDQSQVENTAISSGLVHLRNNDANKAAIFTNNYPVSQATNDKSFLPAVYPVPIANINDKVTYTAKVNGTSDKEETTIPTKCPGTQWNPIPPLNPPTPPGTNTDTTTTGFVQKNLASVIYAAVAFAGGGPTSIDDFDWTYAHAGATVYFEASCPGGENLIHMSPYDVDSNSTPSKTALVDTDDNSSTVWQQIVMSTNATYTKSVNLDIDANDEKCAASAAGTGAPAGSSEESKVAVKTCDAGTPAKDIQGIATALADPKGDLTVFIKNYDPNYQILLDSLLSAEPAIDEYMTSNNNVMNFLNKYKDTLTSAEFNSSMKIINAITVTQEGLNKIKTIFEKNNVALKDLQTKIIQNAPATINARLKEIFAMNIGFKYGDALTDTDCKNYLTSLDPKNMTVNNDKTLTLDLSKLGMSTDKCLADPSKTSLTIPLTQKTDCSYIPTGFKVPTPKAGSTAEIIANTKAQNEMLDKLSAHMDTFDKTKTCKFAADSLNLIKANVKDSTIPPLYGQNLTAIQEKSLEISKIWNDDKSVVSAEASKITPQHGQITKEVNKVTYTASAGYTGEDSAVYNLTLDKNIKYELSTKDFFNRLVITLFGIKMPTGVDGVPTDARILLPGIQGIAVTCLDVQSAAKKETPKESPTIINNYTYISNPTPVTTKAETVTKTETKTETKGPIARSVTPKDIKTGSITIKDILKLKNASCLQEGVAFDFKEDDNTLRLLSSLVYNGKALAEGYKDDDGNRTFRSDVAIRRAEVYKLMAFASCTPVDLPVSPAESFLDENPNDWHYTMINSGKQLKLLQGYEEGKYFKPNQFITRGEALALISRIAKIDDAPDSCTKYPADVKKGSWEEKPAHNAVCANLLAMTVIDGKQILRLNDYMTRGEMGTFIYNYFVHEVEKMLAK